MPLTGQAKVIYQKFYMRKRRQSGLDCNYKGIKCANCGFNEIVDRHHIDRNQNNNDASNLLDLCPNCHALVHRGRKVLKWLPSLDKTLTSVRPEPQVRYTEPRIIQVDADGNEVHDYW